MREIHPDTLHSQELAPNGDNGLSSYNFVPLRDNSISWSDLQKSSMSSLLPNLELVENTSNMNRQSTSSDASRHASRDASRVGDRFGLNPEQRQSADRIEKSILSGDLNTLLSTMSQFAHRGQDLAPILAKVRFDMQVERGINVNYTCNRPGNQCLVEISKNVDGRGVKVYVSTDRREPPVSVGVRLETPGAGDSDQTQKALKKIGGDFIR